MDLSSTPGLSHKDHPRRNESKRNDIQYEDEVNYMDLSFMVKVLQQRNEPPVWIICWILSLSSVRFEIMNKLSYNLLEQKAYIWPRGSQRRTLDLHKTPEDDENASSSQLQESLLLPLNESLPTLDTVPIPTDSLPTLDTVPISTDSLPTMDTVPISTDSLPTMDIVPISTDSLPTMDTVNTHTDSLPILTLAKSNYHHNITGDVMDLSSTPGLSHKDQPRRNEPKRNEIQYEDEVNYMDLSNTPIQGECVDEEQDDDEQCEVEVESRKKSKGKCCRPHTFLPKEYQDNNVEYIINWDTHNMPESIVSSEKSLIARLNLLNTGARKEVRISLGGKWRTFQSWHYVNGDIASSPANTSGTRLEYMDFDDLAESTMLYRYQRLHALVIKSLNNDSVAYQNRVFFSRCSWNHVEKRNQNEEDIKEEFVIVTLLRSRCPKKYLAAVIGHKPTSMVFVLENQKFLNFIRCGWCAVDETIDWDYWKLMEHQVLEQLVYDVNDIEERYIPIDVTNTKNLTSRRPNKKTCHSSFAKWLIAPGQQRALNEMVVPSYERVETMARVQQEKRISDLQSDVMRLENDLKSERRKTTIVEAKFNDLLTTSTARIKELENQTTKPVSIRDIRD